MPSVAPNAEASRTAIFTTRTVNRSHISDEIAGCLLSDRLIRQLESRREADAQSLQRI